MAKATSKGNPFKMDPAKAQTLVQRLTPRERQVAELIAMGLAQSAIAKKLGISTKTLDIFRGNVRKKLGAPTHGIARIWFCAATSPGNHN